MVLGSRPADVYTDFSNFSSLKAKARANSPEALTKVAKQFESVFLQMILKSMRQASFGDAIFDSDQSNLYRDLYDKQLSIHLNRESGLGLAEVIAQQLGNPGAGKPASDSGRDLADYQANPIRAIFWSGPDDTSEPKSETGVSEPIAESTGNRPIHSQTDFIDRLRPHAVRAGRQLGVHPGILLAQAALESGWGQKSIRDPNGQESYNLFGIKADNRWKGPATVVSTLEYEGGIPRRQRARFRSYGGFAEGFQDYVRFIQNNPRYDDALNSAGNPRKYIQALQNAGYATDPDYATKVMTIFNQNRFDKFDFKSA